MGIRGETAFLAGVGTLTLGEWDNFDSREQEKRVLMNVWLGVNGVSHRLSQKSAWYFEG